LVLRTPIKLIIFFDFLLHELQSLSKMTYTSSLYLLRQLDLRQMAGLNEKECKQSARRPCGGQGDHQRHRQESDDLNTKGSIQISYFGRQNGGNEVVGGAVENFTSNLCARPQLRSTPPANSPCPEFAPEIAPLIRSGLFWCQHFFGARAFSSVRAFLVPKPFWCQHLFYA
jgi:hypothetical protein